MEVALLALETDSNDHEAIDTAFSRLPHDQRDGGLSPFNAYCRPGASHRITPEPYARWRDTLYRGYADLALRAADMLKEWVQALQNLLGGAALVPPAGFEELLQVLADPEVAGITPELEPIAPTPPRLGDILVAEGKVDRQNVETVAARLWCTPLGVALLRAGTASLPDVARALRAQRRLMGGEGTMESSVRVRTEHLDHLVEIIGALGIAHAMVAQDEAILHSGTPALRTKVRQVSTLVHALQDLSIALRMVPLTTTFQKMLRVVRDAAHKSGKLVAFCTAGEETDIDRQQWWIASLILWCTWYATLLTTAWSGLRSARRLGKPPTGIIQLRAYRSSGQVVIELEDDGQGLDDAKDRPKGFSAGAHPLYQGSIRSPTSGS